MGGSGIGFYEMVLKVEMKDRRKKMSDVNIDLFVMKEDGWDG